MSSPPETDPPAAPSQRGLLRRALQPNQGDPDRFGRESSFAPPLGGNTGSRERPRGYYIDLRIKAADPHWPPAWLPSRTDQLHVAVIQWGLGAWERYLNGDGERWRAAALAVGDHLIGCQEREGANAGAWLHWFPMPHTYRIDPPWASAIAQGEAASLLVRLHQETGDGRYAEGAKLALAPMRAPTERGGLMREAEGLPFFEEYPTRPRSLVLNGGMFALWGFFDVGGALGDDEATEWFEAGAECVASLLDRYDTGSWSHYDLYPHPTPNIASASYHLLHINQLEVLARMHPDPRIDRVRERFSRYRDSARNRAQAFTRKAAFRMLTPRNPALAHRLPWNARTGPSNDPLVLCYHAVSEHWNSSLAVSPGRLEQQVTALMRRGYAPATFSEALLGERSPRCFAVTFDDAYRSVLRVGLPVLQRLGVPATVFVPGKYADEDAPVDWPGVSQWLEGPDRDELSPLGWDELGHLTEAGWEIGSHTLSHPRLTQLDDADLHAELSGSRELIETRAGVTCLSIAYPYGDHDTRVAMAAASAGYAIGAALPPPYSVSSTLAWPRVGVYPVDGRIRFRLKTSRLGRRLRASAIGPAVARVLRTASGENEVRS